MLQTELTRFKVKAGKTAIVDKWMTLLKEHMEETLLTLENKKCLLRQSLENSSTGKNFCTGIL